MFAPRLVPPSTPNPTAAMSSLWLTSNGLKWTNRKPLLELRSAWSWKLILTQCRFIGKSGGEIFHDMMLRHGVKHICKLLCPH